MKITTIGLGILFFACFFACQKNTQGNLSGAIARVDDSYLFIQDIEGLVSKGTSPEDSLVIVQNYIHTWASKKIIMAASENNMNKEVKIAIDRLVEQYKADLYTNSYIERLVSKSLDTVVDEEDLKSLYAETKNHFTLNENLVKLRLIVVKNGHHEYKKIVEKFKRFNEDDQAYLASIGMQFSHFAWNQEDWVETQSIVDELPFITPETEKHYLIEGNFIEEKDAQYSYLVKVKRVLHVGDESPYEYQRKILKDIVLNRRKSKLIEQLKKEITNNAIKDEKFEVFK